MQRVHRLFQRISFFRRADRREIALTVVRHLLRRFRHPMVEPIGDDVFKSAAPDQPLDLFLRRKRRVMDRQGVDHLHPRELEILAEHDSHRVPAAADQAKRLPIPLPVRPFPAGLPGDS